MKLNAKKIMSLVIVLAFVLSTLPQLAFAVDTVGTAYTKIAEWIPKEIVNTNQIANTVNSNNPLKLANVGYNPPTQILPVSDVGYSVKNYLLPHNGLYDKYTVVDAGTLATQMNNGFTLESWFMPKDGRDPALMTVTDADGNVKFRVHWKAYDQIQAEYIEIVRAGEDSSISLRGCPKGTTNRLSYKWNHIVVTAGANSGVGTLDDVKLYLNGTEYTLTATDETSANTKNAPIAFEDTDIIYFHGPDAWLINCMRLSDTALYSGKFEAADALKRYNDTIQYYETMFDSKLYDNNGNVYPLDSLNSLDAEKVSSFTVDVTEAAANITEDNFEIYNVTDKDIVDFEISNEGTVYTLSNFELEYEKDYQFIIEDIADEDGNFIRTTRQILDIKTVTPATRNKLAEWKIPATAATLGEYSAVLNNLDKSAYGLSLYGNGKSYPHTLAPVGNATYPVKYSIKPNGGIYGNYPVIETGNLLGELNNAFTVSAWFMYDGTNGSNTYFYIKDADGNVKFRIAADVQGTTDQTHGLKYERMTDDESGNLKYAQTIKGVPKNQWFNLTFSVGGADSTVNDVNVWVNGEKVALKSNAAATTTDGTLAPIAFEETDEVGFAGYGTWTNASRVYLSDAAIYGAAFENSDALQCYNESAPYFETMFDSKLYDNSGNVITFNELDSLNAENIAKFTVDVTEAAANVTENNFEIYNVTDNDTVEFDLSNEGTVYTLSGLELEDNKTYRFVIKDIADADGNPIRTAQQILDVKTVVPAIRNKLAEWIPNKIVNQKIVNTVDESNNLNVHPWSKIEKANPVEYSKANYIESSVTAKYNIDNSGTLATKMNNGFTFETWVQLGDTNWNVDLCARLMAVTDDEGNVKFEIRYYPQSASFPKSLTIARYGENGSSVELEGCKWDAVDNRLLFANWHHIVVTVGANGESGALNDVKLYVNGAEKTLSGTATGTGAPLTFEETDLMYLAGPNSSDTRNRTKFSNTAIYGGKVGATDILNRYNEAYPNYETMFDSKLYDKLGNVITLEGVSNVMTVNYGSFTVDVTETAANVSEANFEIYNVTDKSTVDYELTNEGTVYTLSNFTLEAEKDYKFIIKEIADAEGNLIRKTQQVLDVHAVAPSDIKITAAAVAGSGKVSATVTNLADTAKSAILVIASYNGKVLTNIETFETGTLEVGQEFTPETVNVTGGEGITVKFMLWDGKGNIKPYQVAIVK